MKKITKSAIPFLLGFLMCFFMFAFIGCDDSVAGYTKDEIRDAGTYGIPEYCVNMEGVSVMLYSINDDDEFAEHWLNYLSDNGYVYEDYELVDMIIDEL